MRILMPTTSFPRDDRDVAGRFVFDLAASLVERGHTVHVLAPESIEALAIPPLLGLTVEHVPYLRPRTLERTFYGAGVLDNLRTSPMAWPGLASFPLSLFARMKELQGSFDVVLSQFAVPSAMVTAWAVGAARHVAVWHSADAFVATRVPGLARAAEAWADRHIFVAEHWRERVTRDWRNRSRATVEGLGVRVRSDISPKLRQGPLRVASMSRLVPIKQIDQAVLAARELGEDVALRIAGDGPEAQRLQQLAKRSGARVEWLGSIAAHEKDELFEWAEVALALSGRTAVGREEGAPISPLEAMGQGVPLIATDVAAHRSILSTGGGTLIPNASLLGPLTQTLRGFIDERSSLDALGHRAHEAAMARSLETVAARFDQHLAAAMSR